MTVTQALKIIEEQSAPGFEYEAAITTLINAGYWK